MILAIIMVLSLMPTMAFAEEIEEVAEPVEEEAEEEAAPVRTSKMLQSPPPIPEPTPEPSAPAGAVFTIDDSGTMYTLDAAVTDVAEGGTITMTDDFTLNTKSFQFGGEKAFTLDLAGHTITVSDIVISGSSGSINNIKFYNPNMNVIDSSEDKTGAITAKASAQLMLRYDQFWDLTKVTADCTYYGSYSTYPSKVVYEGDLAKKVALDANTDAICMTGGTGYEKLADAVDAGGDILMWGEDSSEAAINLTSGSLTMQDGASYNGAVTVNGGTLTVESGATLKNVTYTSGKLLTDADVTFESLTGAVAKYGPDKWNNEKYVYVNNFDTISTDTTNKIYKNLNHDISIALLDDVTIGNKAWDIGKNTPEDKNYKITLELNGHSVTCNYQINVTDRTLIVNDSSTEKTGAFIASSHVFQVSGAKLIINAGNFTENASNCSVIRGGNEVSEVTINGGTYTVNKGYLLTNINGTVDINNGTFTVESGACLFNTSSNGTAYIDGGDFRGLYVNGTANRFSATNQTVLVRGGTYDMDVIDYCAAGFTCEANENAEADGTLLYHINNLSAFDAVLNLTHNGDVKPLSSIKSAFKQAQDGDTITLLDNLTITDMCYTDANDLTFDLNGKTLTKVGIENGMIRVDHDMTIKNGNIVCNSTSWSSAIEVIGQKDVNLTLDGVTVTANLDNVPLQIFGNAYNSSAKLRLTLNGQNELKYAGSQSDMPAIIMGSDEMKFEREGNSELTIDGTGTLKLTANYGIAVISTCGASHGTPYSNIINIENPNFIIKNNKDGGYKDSIYGNFKYINAQPNPAPSVKLNISAGKFYGNFAYEYTTKNETTYTPAAGETLFDGSQLTGGQYSFKPAARWIADGYEAVEYSNGSYPDLTWEIVKIKQVDAGTATVSGEEGSKVITIETHGADKNISATKKGSGETVATQEVANLITNTLNNDAVSEFDGTNIEANTDAGAIKTELKKDTKVASDDTAKANIDATTNILKQITVDLTATTVDIITDSSSVKEINSMTYEVKPIARTTVVDGEGNEKTVEVVIPNELITAPLTFRLFVAPTDAKEAAVYHKGSEVDATKEYIGMYPIQKDSTTGKYFIELSAQKFSEYTYETVHVTEGAAAVIRNDSTGDFTSYTTLADAIAAVANGKTIILMKDVTETDPINFASTETKAYELDLNGHVLTGTAVTDSAKNVTVSNNDAEKPDCLAVIGVFANNVKAFVADGYDARTSTPAIESVTNNEVFSNNATDVFTVKVVTSTDIDRDETNDGWVVVDADPVIYYATKELAEAAAEDAEIKKVKNVDVFAGDTVHAEVRIYGARSVAAKVALQFDVKNLTLKSTPEGWESKTTAVEGDTISFYDANTDGITYWELDKTDEDGKPYYLLGEFDFTVDDVEESTLASLAGDNHDANGNPVLKDMFEIVEDTYVAGAWKEGWSSNAANKVADEKTIDDWANIRLKQMSVAVTPMTGLVYKNTNLYLFQNKDMLGVDKDFTATDKNTFAEVTGATITYAVLTKAEADGTPNPAYKNETETPGVSQYLEDPKTPAANDYNPQYPTKKDAGDYVVFYKVTKAGYVTVTGQENVSIAKRDATLTWSAAGFNAGSIPQTAQNAAIWTASDFNTEYTGNVFNAPTAKYVNADGVNTSVPTTNITMTTPAGGTLQAVGSYVYTATINDNYNILNPTCTLLIDGGQIKGYTLQNADANGDNVINDDDKSVFVDKQQHAAAKLDIAEDATENGEGTPTVTKTYYLSTDDGKTYGEALTEMPTVTEVGKYAVKVVLSADSFYDQEQIVKFEIKRVEFFTEKTEYVLGWKLILVYTNETVPGFTYGGHYMYDVTKLGYKYLEQKNDLGAVTTEGTEYSHVYAILVNGAGDETLVVPSNDPTMTHTIYPVTNGNNVNGTSVPTPLNRLDTNENGSCDINDLVAVQAVYNVDTVRYLNDAQMHIALKCDVTGNKMVNMADYQMIKSNS